MQRDNKGRFVKKNDWHIMEEALDFLRAAERKPGIPPAPRVVQAVMAQRALAVLEKKAS